MAERADALIAMWDGKSRGTLNMINEAREHGAMTGGKSRLFSFSVRIRCIKPSQTRWNAQECPYKPFAV